MVKIFILFSLLLSVSSLQAETNKSKSNTITKKHLKEQMEKEKKYAKEQTFYQGDDYDLKGAEVNKKSLNELPVIEPDYDFDMTDVYRDDI